MIHLAASLVFIVALLAAAVTIHMTVLACWAEILLALKGEWNGAGAIRPAARPRRPALAARTWHAAF
ncbi:MAG TPA: hypothetical protein VFW19_14965 [Allosphingosinicella sp.]|nr:hypothetical protein [Allosphingosinicella sp.]